MRVFVIAGEPSGDRLGGALMAGLRGMAPEVEFAGVGGPSMAEQGLQSRFDMGELSLFGLAEILPKYRQLKRRIEETAGAALGFDPDVVISIDSPDFCLRVARLIKAKSNVRTVHYVAPSVWAWRPGRAVHMARVIDHVLALLPFEPPLMRAAGMACDFVGHPVVSEPVAGDAEVAAFRTAHGLGAAPLLLVLPGSRRGEVARLAPVFGAALTRVLAARPDLRVVVPAAGAVAGLVREAVSDWPGAPLILDPGAEGAAAHKRAAFRGAAAALAASGTVSVELAAAGTPMVIAYRLNWLTWQIASRMVQSGTVTLVNLVSETRVVPECLGPDCTPERIAREMLGVLDDPSAQGAAMELTMARLGRGGEAPGLRAAKAVLARL